MSSILIEVEERSTQDFDVVVSDPDTGDAVTPTACTYTLTTRDGTVVNELSDEPVTPATSMRITLAGADLQILDETKRREYRILTINTDRANANEPENIEVHFWVLNHVVTGA